MSTEKMHISDFRSIVHLSKLKKDIYEKGERAVTEEEKMGALEHTEKVNA